jgi:hypothetical protein
MMRRMVICVVLIATVDLAAAAEKPRPALAMKFEVTGDTATVTVAFNYIGKRGDAPTFAGVRLYRDEVPVGKGPKRVGWNGKGKRQSVVVAGKKYTYLAGEVDRQENGSLSITRAKGGRFRLTGVYHYAGVLFVVDEQVKPGSPVLLEADGE